MVFLVSIAFKWFIVKVYSNVINVSPASSQGIQKTICETTLPVKVPIHNAAVYTATYRNNRIKKVSMKWTQMIDNQNECCSINKIHKNPIYKNETSQYKMNQKPI